MADGIALRVAIKLIDNLGAVFGFKKTTTSSYPIGAIIFFDNSGNEVPPRFSNNALQVCMEAHHTSFSQEFTVNGSGDLAATSIITPGAGNKLKIHSIFVCTNSEAGTIDLDLLTSEIEVLRMYPDVNTKIAVCQANDIGATNEVLTLTAAGLGNADNVFVKIQYVDEA